jgi:predicted GNAT superfamily acetyltransferase
MIKIAPIKDQAGLRECERLQREIWGFAESAVVPDHLMLTAIRSGGCLLGAYDKEISQLIGFAFSFIGLQDGRLKHASLMTGVLPEVRYQGVGHQLKLAQREFVLGQGLELITWTFDPLQSANAHFNLKKLGVIAPSYERDLYGDMRSELNRGLPSDRFAVEWWLRSPRVAAKLRGSYRLPTINELRSSGAELVNRVAVVGEWPANTGYGLDLNRAKLLAEIPTDTPGMRAKNPELGQRWRAETREIFEHYLARGYLISEFLSREEGERRRGFYLLERASREEILDRG